MLSGAAKNSAQPMLAATDWADLGVDEAGSSGGGCRGSRGRRLGRVRHGLRRGLLVVVDVAPILAPVALVVPQVAAVLPQTAVVAVQLAPIGLQRPLVVAELMLVGLELLSVSVGSGRLNRLAVGS